MSDLPHREDIHRLKLPPGWRHTAQAKATKPPVKMVQRKVLLLLKRQRHEPMVLVAAWQQGDLSPCQVSREICQTPRPACLEKTRRSHMIAWRATQDAGRRLPMAHRPAWLLGEPLFADGSVRRFQWINVVQGEDRVNKRMPSKATECYRNLRDYKQAYKHGIAASGAGWPPGVASRGRVAAPSCRTRGSR